MREKEKERERGGENSGSRELIIEISFSLQILFARAPDEGCTLTLSFSVSSVGEEVASYTENFSSESFIRFLALSPSLARSPHFPPPFCY